MKFLTLGFDSRYKFAPNDYFTSLIGHEGTQIVLEIFQKKKSKNIQKRSCIWTFRFISSFLFLTNVQKYVDFGYSVAGWAVGNLFLFWQPQFQSEKFLKLSDYNYSTEIENTNFWDILEFPRIFKNF